MVPEHLSRLLTAYVDGELRPRQRRSVEHLLQQSPEARALLEGLQNDASEIGDLPRATPVRDLSQGVLRKLGRAAAVPALLPYTIRRPATAWFRHALAASILVGASLGTFTYILTRVAPVHITVREEELPPPYVPEGGGTMVAKKDKEIPSFADQEVPPSLRSVAQPRPPVPKIRHDSGVLTVEPLRVENLKSPSLSVPFIVKVEDINHKQPELHKELSRSPSRRVDVYDAELQAALSALRSGLKIVGTDLLDQNARAQLGLGLEFKSDIAIYLETTNPKDLSAILSHLGGNGPKGRLMVSDLTTDDQGKLANLPEIEATRPAHVKALHLNTEMAALRSASDRTANGTAVAVAFEHSRLHEFFLPPDAAVAHPGDIRALIILHARK